MCNSACRFLPCDESSLGQEPRHTVESSRHVRTTSIKLTQPRAAAFSKIMGVLYFGIVARVSTGGLQQPSSWSHLPDCSPARGQNSLLHRAHRENKVDLFNEVPPTKPARNHQHSFAHRMLLTTCYVRLRTILLRQVTLKLI